MIRQKITHIAKHSIELKLYKFLTMAKYLKRVGTTPERYAVEIQLENVELKLLKPARVSVMFKRGLPQ